MKNRRVLSVFRDYFWLTFGCIVFVLAWKGFMNPNHMSAGGLMGLCSVIQYATGGAVTTQFSFAVINAALIGISVILFGISFGFRTVYCIVISDVLMWLADGLPFLYAMEGSFLYVPEKSLIPIIAGILEATGVGLVIKYGGSTGGTDIIALVVNKYWPVSLSKAFLVLDFFIISAMLLVPETSFSDCVYGFEMMISFALMIDYVIGGANTSFQLMVFSQKYNIIADEIITSLDRGVTVLRAQGWYTKKEKDVLLILVSKNQLSVLTKLIKKTDPRAFMSVCRTANVYGEGFEEIKTGIEPKKQKNNNGKQ